MFRTSYLPLSAEDDYYVNLNQCKHIECILPTAEIMVNFRSNNTKAMKLCYVYAEKLGFKGLIQVRLTEKCNQRKMYITTVDSASFQELKQDQSLHVTFSGFIENLIQILKECQDGKLGIYLIHSQREEERQDDMTASCDGSTGSYKLQFVEMRPFKNLIHLCLPCRTAPLNVVLFYMHNILDEMQKRSLIDEQATQQLKREIHNRNQRIEQLDAECIKLRETLLDTIRNVNQKHADEMAKLQEKISKSTEQRQQDSERSRNTITALKQQIDKLLEENSSVQTEKAYDQKRYEILNEDLNILKKKITNLKESNEKLLNEISSLKNLDHKHDMNLQDSRKEANDLKEILKKYDKNKAELVAELEAEKKISQTKRQALEIATDEISKANQIILKQTQELNKLKKTIEWRTEVALQQEHAIELKDVHIKEKDKQIIFLKHTVDNLRTEIPKELDSMRKYATALDAKYTEQINCLHLKLKPLEKENQTSISKTARRK